MALAVLDNKGRCKKQIIPVQDVDKVMWGKEEEVASSSTVKLLRKANFFSLLCGKLELRKQQMK